MEGPKQVEAEDEHRPHLFNGDIEIILSNGEQQKQVSNDRPA